MTQVHRYGASSRPVGSIAAITSGITKSAHSSHAPLPGESNTRWPLTTHESCHLGLSRRPTMDTSSSISIQCSPDRLSSTWPLCSGVACKRRGSQASGTPKMRPSSRSTQKLCSSKRTASGSGEKLTPSPFDFVASLLDNSIQRG